MLVLYISELLVIAFARKEKSFAIAIIFFFLFFSTTNLDELTKVACQIFSIC